MEKLENLLQELLNEQLYQIVISAPRKVEYGQNIKIRPIMHKGSLSFQKSQTIETKVYHENYQKESMINEIQRQMECYGQMEIDTLKEKVHILISKKGTVTIKRKKKQNQDIREVSLAHNRKKQYRLEEGIVIPFLVDLGIQTKEGKIVNSKYDKFRQINRYLEMIEDIFPVLEKEEEVTILDFGCGKSYLTFAMYHYLRIQKGLNVKIIGLDLKKDVIDNCNRLKDAYGYDQLVFLQGDIGTYEGQTKVDMIVTLHACDIATDFALEKAVKWNAKIIFSVPCCQHELNAQINNDLWEPIFRYGILKERMAALLTDGIRASLLEAAGYQVQVLEFIDMEHTPKNLLIRAVKKDKSSWEEREKELLKINTLCHSLQVEPKLETLLGEYMKGSI